MAVLWHADVTVMTELRAPAPTFRPLLYTADVVVPVINLRQHEFPTWG